MIPVLVYVRTGLFNFNEKNIITTRINKQQIKMGNPVPILDSNFFRFITYIFMEMFIHPILNSIIGKVSC